MLEWKKSWSIKKSNSKLILFVRQKENMVGHFQVVRKLDGFFGFWGENLDLWLYFGMKSFSQRDAAQDKHLIFIHNDNQSRRVNNNAEHRKDKYKCGKGGIYVENKSWRWANVLDYTQFVWICLQNQHSSYIYRKMFRHSQMQLLHFHLVSCLSQCFISTK